VIRVAIAGATGRVGRTLVPAFEEAADIELAGRIAPSLGTALEDVLGDIDVLVDFTRPDVVLDTAGRALEAGVHVVSGTSGADYASLAGVGSANLFFAPNFSIGAVLMMQAAQLIARHLPECEIVEMHHDRKLDAPSGTALRTAELVREAGGNPHDPIHSVRLPGLVGHQEVIFGGPGQMLTIRHDSLSHSSFVPGVLLAVRRVADLEDSPVIGLEALLAPAR